MTSFHPTYAAVRWPGAMRVLGVRLKTVTINHLLLLWAMRSPFVTRDPIEDSHLILAIYVLSRDCERAAKALQKGRVPLLLRAWKWQLAIRSTVLDKAIAKRALLRYLDESFVGPDTWEDNVGGEERKSGAPLLQSLKALLQKRLHCSASEALNYSVREAIWDLYCDAEQEGRCSWVTAMESELLEAAGAN